MCFQLYPGPPYYKGCVFSNGPVYLDIAAGLLNITAQNYAVGGATSGAVTGVLGIPAGFANRTAATSVEVPSTLEQVGQCASLSASMAVCKQLQLIRH